MGKTQNNMSINVYDNFIWDYCMNASYVSWELYGNDSKSQSESNQKYVPGLNHEIYHYLENHIILSEDCRPLGISPTRIINAKKLFDLFLTSIEKKFPEYKPKDMTRFYINCFAPSERSNFHIDGAVGTTFLYYPNDNWNLDEGGETQFIVDNSIFGIPPVTNRLISFDANILHAATPFRNRQRFTVTVKYGIYDAK